MDDRKTYVVKRSGFILGDWRNANAHVPLTEAQALPFVRDGALALLGDETTEAKGKA